MSRIEKTVPAYDSIEEAIDDLDPERMMDDFETNFEHLESEPSGGLSGAIAKAMGEIKRLTRTAEHFQKFKYVPVDEFKDHLRPILAANGLHLSCDEVSASFDNGNSEGGKNQTFATFTFQFHVRHESGEIGMGERTTVRVPYRDAQTTGIAKSYALKEYLKTSFMMSSSDKSEDADHADIEFTSAQMKERGIWAKLEGGIREQKTVVDLHNWYDRHNDIIMALRKPDLLILRGEYKEKLLELRAAEMADPAGDFEDMAAAADQYKPETE